MRLRSVWVIFGLLIAGIVALSSFSGAASAAQKVENPLKNFAVTGSGEDGTFKGSFTITSFEVRDSALYAIGNLKGQLTNPAGKNSKVNFSNVAWPVEAINGVSTDLSTAAAPTFSALAVPQQLACTILDLELGPLDLNLLGLRIQLDQVDLLITAIPGAGLLGDLLCAVTNLLSGGLTLPILNEIATFLNQILAILNQL